MRDWRVGLPIRLLERPRSVDVVAGLDDGEYEILSEERGCDGNLIGVTDALLGAPRHG